jgi:nucleotide-binding universal stress UspA family protein
VARTEQRQTLPARIERTGRVEREVVAAAENADLLVLARDGDRTHLGPRSLGPASRFIVDHAPCPVLLVWPEPAPGIATIPPRHRTTAPPHHR